MPTGINNSFWHKSYFSTYTPDSYVNVSSLGGSVTVRTGAQIGGKVTPLLQVWGERVQQLTSTSVSFYQPWLRLGETSVDPFAGVLSLLPATLRATAFSGDINIAGNLTLAPSPTGTVELLAARQINGLQPTGRDFLGNTTWSPASINVSDADPASIPGALSPFGYQNVSGLVADQAIRTRSLFLEAVDRLFRESGGTIGLDATLQTKQARHTPGLLHLGDESPTRLYTGRGDISGLTFFSPKPAQIFAGRDITDVAFYLQNLEADDTSIVTSGRDITLYNSNSPLRVAATTGKNLLFPVEGTEPQAGDIQISGPGNLQVLAGRNLDLGTGLNNPNGTGVGITSIGNARNPYLPFEGANIVIGAGIAAPTGLANSTLQLDAFIKQYVDGPTGQAYLQELSAELGGRAFADLGSEEQARVALQVFYLVLRDAGRNAQLTGNYDAGYQAIATLFGTGASEGEIFTRARDLRTRSGGAITMMAPGGGLTLASTSIGNPLSPPGIITESGGRISIFTNTDVNIGIGRIFTLRGGDAVIWSSAGDIAAGSAPKTVQSAPPTRVLIDPQTGSVDTDLAGLATGGGIGVLATVQGVAPGNVDLIAPIGTVDAGDAGIRVSGNLSIAAVQVLNADNIAVNGSSVGTPSVPTVSAPSLGSVTAGNSTAGATANAAAETARQARTQPAPVDEAPSFISVQVVSFGDGEGTAGPTAESPEPLSSENSSSAEEDELKRKRRKQQAQ
jgi:hypothetical protein